MTPTAKTLVVAPYAGEFGWELMNWQGRVRRLAARGGHERVVVCARTDRRPLYVPAEGQTPVVFCPLREYALPGMANEDHRVHADGRAVDTKLLRELVLQQVRASCEAGGVDLEHADLLMPGFRGEVWSTRRSDQHFENFRRAAEITVDVLLVPRERSIAPERNCPPTWWEELAARLAARGLRVETYRRPLDAAIRQLSSARLAAGASTGGLHLASLCGCPHYVWGSGGESRWTRLGITNRQRYETVWNPLGTPCVYDECGWRPALDDVEAGIVGALDAIGLSRSAATRGWGLRPTWRIKRGLARVLESPAGSSRWPWRVQQLVRERLV